MAASIPTVNIDELREIASEPIIRRGVAYFREDRVMELDGDGSALWASVEGSDQVYLVEMELDEDGELTGRCDCPFEMEPVCKHMVATLLAWTARQPVSASHEAGAAGDAVARRQVRARTEVSVRRVVGHRWPSVWEASTVKRRKQRSTRYTVEIRDSESRLNTCTCPDFAVNRLGTCKHIEAVLLKLAKKARGRVRQRGSLVHLDWSEGAMPVVRLRRGLKVDAALEGRFQAHFNSANALMGEVPEALDVLAQAFGDELHIGSDVRHYMAELGARQVRRLRAQSITDEIMATQGRVPGVNAQLYPYQVEGVAFLASAGRGLLADDMGLGKTLQTLAAARWLMDNEAVERTLVICPASLKHQWAREVERFLGVEVTVVNGPAHARHALYRRRSPITIVNYEQVLRDAAMIQEELRPDLLVLDEAQRIKNWRTRTAEAVKSLHTRYAFMLSGTPLENRLEDLYSLFQVIDPHVLGPLWQFMLHFHVTDGSQRVIGYRNLSELRSRLADTMLRRDRRIVREQLPDRIQNRYDVKMTPKQVLYDGEARDAAGQLAAIAKHRPLTPNEQNRMMAALQRARMACNAAGLVDHETEGSPKLDELGRLLEELCIEGGRKVVVFSQWVRMTEMAEDVAQRLGLGCVRLHGGVPSAARGALIQRFEDDPGIQVFLATDAGSTGLNLQAATALINLEMPWNPAVLEQRIARVHRLGQTEPVQIALLVASGGYEGHVVGLMAGKRDLFNNVVTSTPETAADAVGISKRSLEAALATLDATPKEGAQEAPISEPTEDLPPAAPNERAPRAPDEDLAPVVAALGALFGGRMERLVAGNGALLAVLDRVDDGDGDAVHAAALACPVALVDAVTFGVLSQMGGGAVDGTELSVSEALGPDPLVVRAQERYAEAMHGFEAHGPGIGLSLLADAMRLALGAGVGEEPPEPARCATWLFGTLLPAGRIGVDDANTLLRVQALAEAPEVSEALVASARSDARAMLDRL